jgi:hypothetical protein
METSFWLRGIIWAPVIFHFDFRRYVFFFFFVVVFQPEPVSSYPQTWIKVNPSHTNFKSEFIGRVASAELRAVSKLESPNS